MFCLWTLILLVLPQGLNASPALEDATLTACTGAPAYPCGGANVGGWEPWWEWISRVQLDAIDKQSQKEAYVFFDNEGPAVLTEGQQVRVQLTPGLSWSGYQTHLYWRVFIDYNRDGDFDDAGETVIEQNGVRLAIDETITIPNGVDPGCTRIRVSMQRDAYADPCESFSFGEVEDYLATLVAGGGGGGGGGPQLCADRDLINAINCNNQEAYNFYGRDLVAGLSNVGDRYRVTNGSFQEFDDGTATYTAHLVNLHNTHARFDAVVNFSGRTATAPAGSPKQPFCGQSFPANANLYYYTQTSGTFTGRDALAGGVFTVTRRGEAFQVGIGANLHEGNEFGASGWLDYTIVSQPNGNASFLNSGALDINTRLSGSPTACVTNGGNGGGGGGSSCAGNLITNPGFESGGAGWTYRNGAANTSHPVNSGQSALRLDHPGSYADQTVSAGPGANYQFKFFAKDHSDATNSRARIFFRRADGTTISSKTELFVTGGYQMFTVVGTTPAHTASIKVRFVRPSSGTNNEAWVDDVCLTVDAAPSAITLADGTDVTVAAAPGATSATVSYQVPAASTTCAAGGLQVTRTGGPASGAAFPVGATTVTFEATDACGNTATSDLVVTVTATAATSISLTCPADVTTPQIASYGADVFILPATASTTCGTGGVNVSYAGGPVTAANQSYHFPVGTTTVTVSATDACGNANSCTFDITVTPSGGGGGGGSTCTGNGPSYPCGGANVGGWEPWWEWISRVEFDGIDNSSGKEAYRFFSNVGPASAAPGDVIALHVTPGLSWPGYQTNLYYTAYIDFNGDGDFDDAGEEVLRDNALSAGVSTNVTIPAGASQGLTRLRIAMQRDAYAGPCENFSFGEVEDYLVCIGGGTPPASSITLSCPANGSVQLAAGQTQAQISYTVPTASTTCAQGGLSVTRLSGPANGANRAAGTYTIVYRATDACGNQEDCSFTYTVTAAPAPPTCADRSVTDNVSCGNGQAYSFFGDFVRNVSGDDDYFSFHNGNLKEFTDGTARLTGLLVNTHRSDVRLFVDVTLGGRTQQAPSGSPKANLCGNGGQTSGYYYYTTLTGQLTGTEHLAGGQIQVNRMGPAFQVGIGANINEPTQFGASGWMSYTILSQPTGAATFITGQQLDFNVRLDGSPTACTGGGASSCNDDILFVVGSTPLNAGDAAVLAKLNNKGYNVTVKDQHQATTAQASGKGLVIISSTVHSGNIGSKYTHVNVPVLTWESWLYDDLKMTGTQVDHDYGSGWGYTKLVRQNSHPISAGLSGTRTVMTHSEDYRWGKPSANAVKVAYPDGASSHTAIFAYEAGDHMVGKDAPAKRIGWFFDDDSASKLTADGWRYFTQAVAWATDCSSNALVQAPPVEIYGTAVLEGVNVEWISTTTQDDEVYVLEKLDSEGEWNELTVVDLQNQAVGTASFDFLDREANIGDNTYRVTLASRTDERRSELETVVWLSSENVTAYPNPTSDVVQVSLAGFTGFEVQLRICDQFGRELDRIEIEEASDRLIDVDLSVYGTGVFTIHAQANAATKALPIVVVR